MQATCHFRSRVLILLAQADRQIQVEQETRLGLMSLCAALPNEACFMSRQLAPEMDQLQLVVT